MANFDPPKMGNERNLQGKTFHSSNCAVFDKPIGGKECNCGHKPKPVPLMAHDKQCRSNFVWAKEIGDMPVRGECTCGVQELKDAEAFASYPGKAPASWPTNQEFIDRVVKAISDTYKPAVNPDAPYAKVMAEMAACNVIKAMLEPSEEMLDNSFEQCTATKTISKRIWQAMLGILIQGK